MKFAILLPVVLAFGCGSKTSTSDYASAVVSSADLYKNFLAVPLAQRTAYFDQIGAFSPKQWNSYLAAHRTELLRVDGMTIDPAAGLPGTQTFTHLREVWTALGRNPATISEADIQIMELLYAASKTANSGLQLTMLVPGDQDIQQNFCNSFRSDGTEAHMTFKTWADLPPKAMMGKYSGMGGIISVSPANVYTNTIANEQSVTTGTLWKPDDPSDPTGLMVTVQTGPSGYPEGYSQPAVTTKTDVTPDQYQAVCSALNRYGQSPEWKKILANGLTQLSVHTPRPIPGYSGGVVAGKGE